MICLGNSFCETIVVKSADTRFLNLGMLQCKHCTPESNIEGGGYWKIDYPMKYNPTTVMIELLL